MAQRWIVTISQDNLKATLEHNQIGLPERRRDLLRKVRLGDTVVFYIGKKREGYAGPSSGVHQFGPIAKVTSKEFFSNVPIWKSRSGESFPSRLSISVISDGKVDAAKVIPHLSFIQNKDKWGLYFLTGIRAISEADYKILFTAIK